MKQMSPRQFLKLATENPDAIKESRFVLPRIGRRGGGGYFVVELDELLVRRHAANAKYLGAGKLDLSNDHPSEIKRAVKRSLMEKLGLKPD